MAPSEVLSHHLGDVGARCLPQHVVLDGRRLTPFPMGQPYDHHTLVGDDQMSAVVLLVHPGGVHPPGQAAGDGAGGTPEDGEVLDLVRRVI
ncbi:MAG: hypothetical protein HOZ81_45270 [Streptomyces sp.]|nr:hypothetical protein [Streptomyces sp.]